MKRLYIVLTIILSSFFLLYGKEVKADTWTFTVDLSLINNDFFTFKDSVEAFLANDTTYSNDYVIYYSNGDYYATTFPDNYSPYAYTSSLKYMFHDMPAGPRIIQKDNYTRVEVSGSAITNIKFPYLLYSSIPFHIIGSNTYVFNYENISYTFSYENNDDCPTLYDLYLKINDLELPVEPTPVDNTPILTSFYTIVIDKINYLCEAMVSNYVYISIFIIFLLIFLFKLIFGRYL